MTSISQDVRKRTPASTAKTTPSPPSPPVPHSVEQRIAEVLQQRTTFEGELTASDLEPILRNVVHALIENQRFGGLDVPTTHTVTTMRVSMHDCEAAVFCEVHIHSPIVAFLQFRYHLINDPKCIGQLRLKGGRVEVSEDTRRFDFAAKAALKVLNVPAMAMRELSDPNDVIRRTLPPQLAEQGIEIQLEKVDLTLTPKNTMLVKLGLVV